MLDYNPELERRKAEFKKVYFKACQNVFAEAVAIEMSEASVYAWRDPQKKN